MSVVAQVWSPAWHRGLRIWHCQSCGIDCSCSLDSIPSSGTSIFCGCSQKKISECFWFYLYIYIYTHTRTFIHICTQKYLYLCKYIYTGTCIFTCMYICISIPLYIFRYIKFQILSIGNVWRKYICCIFLYSKNCHNNATIIMFYWYLSKNKSSSS